MTKTWESASSTRNFFWKIYLVRRQKKNLALLMLSVAMSLMLSLNRYIPYGKKRELEARQLTSEESTEFYSYFVNYVAEDMKSMMIASVRKKTGFDDSFFYNNDPESMNNRIKTRMKKRSSVGLNAYSNSRKC